jgi:hypothetical protein
LLANPAGDVKMPKQFISHVTEKIQRPPGPHATHDQALDHSAEDDRVSRERPAASRDIGKDIRKNFRKVIQTTERALSHRPKG